MAEVLWTFWAVSDPHVSAQRPPTSATVSDAQCDSGMREGGFELLRAEKDTFSGPGRGS